MVEYPPASRGGEERGRAKVDGAVAGRVDAGCAQQGTGALRGAGQ